MHPLEQRFPRVGAIVDYFGLGAGEAVAVETAYRTVHDVFGPIVTSVVDHMAHDFRASVARNPAHRIAFLGRDGHALAAALRGLDPGFFERHCSEVVLSRQLADDALRDAEYSLGTQNPQVAALRGDLIGSPTDVGGTARMLTRYLRSAGIPVGRPDSAVTIVDNGFKGSIQELLAALYPRTTFSGAYMAYLGTPDDPHPGTKRGYLVDMPEGPGTPFGFLPEDRAQTFASLEGVQTYEYLLAGPLTTAAGLERDRPVQGLQSRAPMNWSGLAFVNPVLVDERLRPPTTRDAVKAGAWLAIHDYARTHAVSGASRESLDVQRDAGTEQVHNWVARSGPVEPELHSLLDSFAPRMDASKILKLYAALGDARLPAAAVRPWWEGLAKMADQDKGAYVDGVAAELRKPKVREAWAKWAVGQGVPVEPADAKGPLPMSIAAAGWAPASTTLSSSAQTARSETARSTESGPSRNSTMDTTRGSGQEQRGPAV
ncbi:hypothetical protein [Embleya sp. NPDC001921]